MKYKGVILYETIIEAENEDKARHIMANCIFEEV
jgi:hypothetical protein